MSRLVLVLGNLQHIWQPSSALPSALVRSTDSMGSNMHRDFRRGSQARAWLRRGDGRDGEYKLQRRNAMPGKHLSRCLGMVSGMA
ncbi:uncharacterized protein SPSK_02095 [Sporothrix schenckii 1099-18]|uniref:Uncharacterized protein n=1 Tax=Sporothrix schenckii 1099-18 TaxID=1397361 RepID=A0A0F2MBB4_SPOSC|nr:uncharacterized protein SPSK_02095 [Sporothrix schenckii 1099-18]KJR86978.1 hypothetical protein SPSK_02095 [Sporothrix schenckii 1099-18]